MIKTFSKVLGLLLVALFIFTGCEDKTVVTETKPKMLEEKAVPQGKIETHAAKKVEKATKVTVKRDIHIIMTNMNVSPHRQE
jgi:hypothetical protein